MHELDALENMEGYCRLFTNVSLWAPYVHEVLGRHNLEYNRAVRTGIPGTCPVFIAGERWIVKFFGRLFDGAASFEAEREVNRLALLDPCIHAARMAASGALGTPGWPWPYLIFEFIPGVSIGEAFEALSLRERLRAARDLGAMVRRLHSLPLADSTLFPGAHQPYAQFLEAQRAGVVERQRAWGSLAPHLAEEIEDFLPPLEALAELDRPAHLIHADLTRDHLLGRVEGGWRSLALIDFGDAMTGSLFYELGPLHLDLFNGDRRLLAAFLDSYALPEDQRANLGRGALATALLHRFDLFGGLPPELRQAPSLAELASALYP